MGGKGIGSAAQQCFVHRLAIHTDAGSKGLAPGMVDTSTDPLCLQDGRQQTRHRRFTGSACHAHELHLLHRRGERGAQLLGGGKTVRQGGKILISCSMVIGYSLLRWLNNNLHSAMSTSAVRMPARTPAESSHTSVT